MCWRRRSFGQARGDRHLVFGRTAVLPFTPSTVRRRALDAWAAAGPEPLSPHEARHCFVSYLIASRMNPKQVQTYVGHTYNVYGHLLDGDVDTARAGSTRSEADLAGECCRRMCRAQVARNEEALLLQGLGSTATGIRKAGLPQS